MQRKWDSEHKDLYINEASGIYYVRYWSPKLGREIEKSLRTKIRAQAIRNRKALLEEIPFMRDRQSLKYKNFNQVIDMWREQKTPRAKATETIIELQLRLYIRPYFGEYAPERVDNALWSKFVNKKREERDSFASFNTKKYLTNILNFAHDQGIIRKRVLLEDMDKDRESVGRLILNEEIELLLKHARNDFIRDMITISVEMAMRWSEIRLLTWDRINFKTGVITLRKQDTKTRRARYPVMTKAVQTLLKNRKANARGPWVFPSPDNHNEVISKSDEKWQQTKVDAGVDCRFHDIRHTALTRLFKATSQYANICEYAGLSVKEALKTYVKFTHDDMRAIAELSGETRGTK